MNVALPKSRSTETRLPGSLIHAIDRNGGLRLEGQRVAMSGLSAILTSAMARASDRTVVIKSNRGVPFDRVVEVMETARDGGAEAISFLVERVDRR